MTVLAHPNLHATSRVSRPRVRAPRSLKLILAHLTGRFVAQRPFLRVAADPLAASAAAPATDFTTSFAAQANEKPCAESVLTPQAAQPKRQPNGCSAPAPTAFLSASQLRVLLRTIGVKEAIAGMAQCIQADFARWGEFDKTARVASHSVHGVVELMPIADASTYAFKYVNGHPGNAQLALPTVMAFGVLADVATGLPRLVSELTLTTALRTAATSAVAARALARPNSRVMAIIGNGAQSEFQAIAFAHLLGIERFQLFDIDAAASAKLQRNLRNCGLHSEVFGSIAQAVCDADIITTLTADKTRATILTPEMIEPGMHINAVGGDCPGKTELHPDVLRAAQVFVEYEPQTRIEGDIQQMPADFAVTELWQVLTGHAPGRAAGAAGQSTVTVFDSVGFALEDFSALRYVFAAAEHAGLLEPLDLVPTLADPKDLFSLLR